MIPATPTSSEEKLYSLAEERLCRRFSIAELQSATQNFDDSLVVGKGGFGKVYKGYIHGAGDPTARLVAVKRLDSLSSQGASEFRAEIEILSKLRHCNLVSLIGYCSDSKEMILVYEYMPNGTVEHHLRKADPPLSWMLRLKISIGAARGLDYLHTGVGTQAGVIHRDVKSSNILLDESWAAKISDFGLSKRGPTNQTSSDVITAIKGTFGYLDPEYYDTGLLTRKSDVYAFGVVLFELLSGRRAVDTRFSEEEWSLAKWAQKCVREKRLDQIVCSHITGQISSKCLKEFAQIANRCLNSRNKRPTMAEVVVALQQSMASQVQSDNPAPPAGAMGFTHKMQKYFATKNNSADADPKSSGDSGLKVDFEQLNQGLRIFLYSDLELATRNFSSYMSLGREHYGEVFRGWLDKRTYSPSKLDSGLAIAVKRLNLYKFKLREVKKLNMKILGEFSDPNVVKILGYCVEEDVALIVYEFMHQGTLKDYLFSDERSVERHQLITRVKIAIGVARGLVFLHSHPQLADCSLQMHNVLLDEEYNAKLSDFDTIMLLRSNAVPLRFHQSSSYYLNVKSGVFSFGVVLLQLLTGQRVANECDLAEIRHSLPGEHGFVSMQCIQCALDKRLKLNLRLIRPAGQLVVLAQKCVADESYLRPTFESVLKELEEIYAIM